MSSGSAPWPSEKLVALRIRAPSIDTTVRSLSGGNQQKVQVARWLVAGTRVLLLDDPTRGVDVGARAEIHALLADLATAGCALLWVSSDAEELVDVADRILDHAPRAGSWPRSRRPKRARAGSSPRRPAYERVRDGRVGRRRRRRALDA